jgi:hypothetical protein
MTTTKQVKIGFHGNSYWLLWHWEVLTPTTATLHGSSTYVSGPYGSLEAAEATCQAAIVEGWAVDPNSVPVDPR